jgi:hypothetical protein
MVAGISLNQKGAGAIRGGKEDWCGGESSFELLK